MIRFFGDHWPKLLALYITFGTSFGKFARGLVSLVVKSTTKLVAVTAALAAKAIGGKFGGRLGKFASFVGGPRGKLVGVGIEAAAAVGGTLFLSKQLEKFSGIEEKPQKVSGYSGGGFVLPKFKFPSLGGSSFPNIFDMFNSSGYVSGDKGVDKVPAMLTDGEFVMSRGAVEKYGVDPNKPYLLFVGRITRQKGIVHLVNAIQYIDPDVQIVLCAGAPDTKEIAAEMEATVTQARQHRSNIIWIQEMVSKPDVIQLYSHATLFCCPSIYEPFGIINLEAMACHTAVVASAVGGIKEVVVHGETGLLVPLEQQTVAPFEPVDPDKFSRDLADAVNQLLHDDELRHKMAENGRNRAVEIFSWSAIAKQTEELYAKVINPSA